MINFFVKFNYRIYGENNRDLRKDINFPIFKRFI